MSAELQETRSRLMERCAEAVRCHRAGRREEAGRIYREILDADPNHVDSLHLLGVLANDAGKHEEAVELIGRALQQAPAYAVAHNNLGNALLNLGRMEDA